MMLFKSATPYQFRDRLIPKYRALHQTTMHDFDILFSVASEHRWTLELDYIHTVEN